MSSFSHYFIGIPIAASIQQWLASWQEATKEKVSYKSWTNPLDFHITLKFLGATSTEEIQAIHKSLQTIQQNTFSVQIGTLGFFGKRTQPRVMWAGVQKNKELQALYEEVEEICVNLGRSKETRVYTPHITLAKKWRDSAIHIDQSNVKIGIRDHSMQTMDIDQFHIYQIHPHQQVKYDPIFTYKLK